MRENTPTVGAQRYGALAIPATLPDRLLFAAALAAVAVFAAVQFWPPLNGDVSAILYFAQRMLAGDRLYVDLIDVNPPVVFWLSLVPAWMSAHGGIAIGTAFALFVIGLVALSLRLAAPAAAALFRDRPLALAFSPLLALFVLLVMPAHNFGQREHLMVILALPYLALAGQRLAGLPAATGLAAAIGAVAAVGFCIKPYFGLTPLLVELLLAWRLGLSRWARRAELWSLAVTAALLVLAVVLVTPAYLDEMVPLIGRQYVTVGLQPVLQVLGDEDRWILEGGLVLLTAAALLRRDSAAQPFACLTIAGLIAAMLQGKGWDYHLLPAWAALVLGSGLVLLPAVERLFRAAEPRPLASAAALFALMLGLHVAVQPPFAAQRGYPKSLASRLESVLLREAAGQPVLWLSSSIYPQFPVVLYGKSRMAMRFMNLWVLDSVYRAEPSGREREIYRLPKDMKPDERLVFGEVAEALARGRPALLLVAPASEEVGFAGQPFDYIEYFSRHPAFAEALESYEEIAPVGAIRIFRRRPPAPEEAP